MPILRPSHTWISLGLDFINRPPDSIWIGLNILMWMDFDHKESIFGYIGLNNNI